MLVILILRQAQRIYFENIEKIRDLSNSIYPTSLADELPLFTEAMKQGE